MNDVVAVNTPSEAHMLAAFANFLKIDVANGDASADTVRGYRTQVGQWIAWCQAQGINPATATATDVKEYRQALVSEGYKTETVAFKLTIVRRFYDAAKEAGFRPDNPATGVKAPRSKKASDDLGYLSEVELALLLRAVPKKTGAVKELRDRAMLALMGLHGLRTVEIERASVEDWKPEAPLLLVRGKGHDRVVYLRRDVAEAINAYLVAREPVRTDNAGTPLFAAVGNFAGGGRISRRGIRKMVDACLARAELKRPGVSGHALRHTAATLAYKYTRDLRGCQEMLGHSDPKVTSRYISIINKKQNNPAAAVPVDV